MKKVKKSVKTKVQSKSNKSKEPIFKKKSEKLVRVPTYIPYFDFLIKGGFEKNSVNLLVGSAGSGKTIFATQYLVEGMKRGEKCLYVTFEERKDEFYRNMGVFGWELEDFEKKGLLTFLSYSPSKVRSMLDEGGGEIENVIINKKISRIVIDSITSFALLFEDELSKREASLSLFSLISSWDCTSLLTYEEESVPIGVAPISKALEFEADAIINLYYIRIGKVRKRFIEILKMRGTEHSQGIHEMKITNQGFIVEKVPTKNKLE